MASDGARSKTGFSRCIKAMCPSRVLRKVRDLYVRNLLDCSGRVSTYAAAGCSNMGSTMGELPRSFSRNSSRPDDEYVQEIRELIKATVEKLPSTKSEGMVPIRSYSVRMWRIDEDRPFEEDGLKGSSKGEKFPRSRSYAHPRKWVGV